MEIPLTRNILLFANFILKQKISKQIMLHARTSTARVRMRLKPKAVHSGFVKYLLNPFPRRKRVNKFVNFHFL